MSPTDSLDEPTRKPRWYRFTADRLVVGLLLIECLLWMSERWQWFPFNAHKGWTVLIGLAGIGLGALVMLLWFIAAVLWGWRFQFSIRSLLLLTVTVAVPCSWLAVERKAANKQREAVEEIRRCGGQVQYDYQYDVFPRFHPSAEPPEPPWLRNLLGDDFFSHVRFAILPGTQVTDAWLEHLKDLPQLLALDLDGTQVTDAGLQHLKDLPRLWGLGLSGTQVTDAGLERLKGLAQLQALELHRTQVTDAGLEHLNGLTQLEDLRLDDTQVTDAGLEHLKRLTRLKLLYLIGTQVTDAGLEHLKGLTQLQSLFLDKIRVTNAGVNKLKQALPECEIYR